MRTVQRVTCLGSALCVGATVIALSKLLRHERLELVALATTYCGGILIALAVRLWALRWVVATRKGWTLVGITGRSRTMPQVTRAYPSGEDVIAVTTDGHRVVLGIDKFPFRDAAVARRTLVARLPMRASRAVASIPLRRGTPVTRLRLATRSRSSRR